MHSLNRSWLWSGLLVLAACLGTSTGNPIGGDRDEPANGGNGTGEGGQGGLATGGGGNCVVDSATEIAPDAETPLGFKASDVLAFLESAREEKLSWNPQQNFSYGPESGQHALSLSITRKGAPRLTKYKMASGPFGEIGLVGGDSCSDAIEIDLEVKLKTDQGALDETFETTVVVRHAKLVTIYHRLKDDKPNGSFAVGNISLPNARLIQLTFNIQLTPFGTQGSFSGIVEQRFEATPGSSSGGAIGASAGGRDPIASWGPRSCGYNGTAVPRTAKIDGFSGDDVLALVNRAQSGSVTFQGAQPSSATLSFVTSDEHVCAVLNDGLATIGGKGAVHVRATLKLKSADGRVDASWQVEITAKPDASGALDEAAVAFDEQQIMGTGDFAAKYGITGLDVSGYDSAIAHLTLSASSQQPLEGDLVVNGFKNQPCMPAVIKDDNGNVVGSGGCRGADIIEVARARISTR